MYDERMLHFISQLSEIHLNPEASDPIKIAGIPDDERSEGEGRPNWYPNTASHSTWHGLYKDVGIFTEHEWNLLMCKCLASMGKHQCRIYKEVRINVDSPSQKSHWQMVDH